MYVRLLPTLDKYTCAEPTELGVLIVQGVFGSEQ